MGKKKKKNNGLREFEIEYGMSTVLGSLYAKQEGFDEHDAILKFKQGNPSARVKGSKEIKKPVVDAELTTGNTEA